VARANPLKKAVHAADTLDGGRSMGPVGHTLLHRLSAVRAKDLNLFSRDYHRTSSRPARNSDHLRFARANPLKNETQTADTLDGGRSMGPVGHTLPHRLSADRTKDLNLFSRDYHRTSSRRARNLNHAPLASNLDARPLTARARHFGRCQLTGINSHRLPRQPILIPQHVVIESHLR
jgi:hypothetical protein